MILLDTHILFWLIFNSRQLSKDAVAAIHSERTKGGALSISAGTLIEIAGLARKGRISLRSTPEAFFREIEVRFDVKPITARICAETMRLPDSYPKDPMDRIIGATAIVEGCALITADAVIQASKALETVW